MKIVDILELERHNLTKVILLKEGIFWRVYEKSAMQFVTDVKILKLTKRYIKTVGCDVASSGFPDSSLSVILNWVTKNGYATYEKSENMIVLSGFPEISYFEEWKEKIVRSVKSQNQGKQYALATEKKHLNEPLKNELPQKKDLNDQIAITTLLNEVRDFPLGNKTPIETMIFFAEIQDSLKSFFAGQK